LLDGLRRLDLRGLPHMVHGGRPAQERFQRFYEQQFGGDQECRAAGGAGSRYQAPILRWSIPLTAAPDARSYQPGADAPWPPCSPDTGQTPFRPMMASSAGSNGN
jgi:hypothetical protein